MTITQLKEATTLAVFLAGVMTARADGWIGDASVGCQVLNPPRQPKRPNGFVHERGAAQRFKNNLPFETDKGEWRAGRHISYGAPVWLSGRCDGSPAPRLFTPRHCVAKLRPPDRSKGPHKHKPILVRGEGIR
jgi:hypothetical protein